MHHIKEQRENFSTAPTFNTSSKWASPMFNVQLDIFLSKLERK